MALQRKFLETLLGEGNDNKIDEIIEKHRETVDALKAERDTAKETAGKVTQMQEELERLRKAVKDHEDDPYKGQYEEIKKQFDDYKKDVEAKATKAKKADAYKALLKEAKVSEKRLDSILRVSAIDDIELDENGVVKDKENVLKKITEDWSDFIMTEERGGQNPPKPPKTQGGENETSRAAQVAAKFYAARYGAKPAGGDGGEKK